MAHKNGFPKHIIYEVKNKIRQRDNTATHKLSILPQPKTWIKFTFHSPAIYKVTNLFKNTDLKIYYRTTNMIFQQLSQKTKNSDPPGAYRINCNTCKKAYVGQSGRSINSRCKEHIRYIQGNNATSAYTTQQTRIRDSNSDATITETLPKGNDN
jgi:hypothetical protein